MVRQDAVTTTGRASGMPSQAKPRCVSATRAWVRAGFAPSEPTRNNVPSTTNHAFGRATRHEHRVPTKPRHPRRPSTRTWVRAGFAPSERTRSAPGTTHRVVLEATRRDNRVRSEQQHGRVLAARTRRRVRFAPGAIALLTTVIVAVALVGGFSSGTPKQDLAAQDQAVALSNRLGAIQRQHAAAQRQLVQTRREVARAQAASLATTRSSARVSAPRGQHAKTFVDQLCAPTRPRAATGPQRRAQRALELRRKQALYYLNLSCPAA